MEDVGLLFIAVWGAGRSVDGPFQRVNRDGWKIKPKNNKKRKRQSGCGPFLEVCHVACRYEDEPRPASIHSLLLHFSSLCSHDDMRGESIVWDSYYIHSLFIVFFYIYFCESPKHPNVIPGRLLCPSHSASIFIRTLARGKNRQSRTRRRRTNSAHFNQKY